MLGTYPIIINGDECGTLTVSKEGAYTRFVAKCHSFGGVIRLSVYGGGVEGYLGVPMPAEKGMRLDKRFSPAAMKAFPVVIERCSLSGEKPEPEIKPEPKMKEEKAEEDSCPDKGDEEGSTFWYATSDGALVSKDGEREMVALPPEDARVPKNIPGQPRIIDGKEYLVYITKEM